MSTGSLASRFTNQIFYARLASLLLGFILAIVLIFLGYSLTQQEIDLKQSNTEVEASSITLDFKTRSFALKNTAPGLVLITCGTIIAVASLTRVTRVKTQWKAEENAIPGMTEAKG